MAEFKKRKYNDPKICNQRKNLSKDWYVYFTFKEDGKVHRLKRREGVNRIKELDEKLIAMDELLQEIIFDLRNGWNPITDPKREYDYDPNTYVHRNIVVDRIKKLTRDQEIKEFYRQHFEKKGLEKIGKNRKGIS